MPFPINDDPRYFSLTGFAGIVSRAASVGYRITSFRDFAAPGEAPVLLLRHDLDGPLSGARAIAELEANLGVQATYFVQTAGEFYNLLGSEGRSLLRRLVELGHEVGLHYEARRYVGDGGRAALASDLRLLEDLTGRAVASASQHIPVDGDAVALDGHIENDAYAPRFTEPPMTYISDSLMAWRARTPHDLIDRRASFQLLTHPETWVGGYRHMGDALDGMLNEEIAAVRARYRSVASYYAKLIEERAERDRRFREARSGPPRPLGAPLT
jgi:hypothetical protein